MQDNCVGQNKSHALMQFYAWLSLWCYETVIVIYLIPGHSHFAPDVATAWMCQTLKNKNTFTPSQLLRCVNSCDRLEATWLQKKDTSVGWEDVLNR